MPTLPKPPVIPSPEEVYALLMGKIEPELLRANLPVTKAALDADPPQKQAERKERYKKAFAKYFEELQKYTADLKQQSNRYYHESLHFLEEEDRRKETSEAQFDALVAAA